jgi:hypothetical protein
MISETESQLYLNNYRRVRNINISHTEKISTLSRALTALKNRAAAVWARYRKYPSPSKRSQRRLMREAVNDIRIMRALYYTVK